MAHTSSKWRRVVSFLKGVVRSRRYQPLLKKPWNRIWWVYLRSVDVRNSSSSFRIMTQKIQKPMKVCLHVIHWLGLELSKIPFSAVVKKFELEPNTIDFIGHAVALYINDDFLNRPAIDTIEKIKLYMDSIGRYGDSPFIYPIYGLGGCQIFIPVGIPEGFSRMAAVNGGTFMLNADVDEVIFDKDGKVFCSRYMV